MKFETPLPLLFSWLTRLLSQPPFSHNSVCILDTTIFLQLGYILEECGLQPEIIPDFVYDEAFAHYDKDGGGTITINEFREFLMEKLLVE